MNESEIPIDIHTGKLQEWLISRRIVPKNIQPYIKDVQSKISNALNDMPENEKLVKLLSGVSINYFHCKDIINILKETEKDTKSVFGTYGSQRMKDWQEIIKTYEKENVYIGEAAQIFVRNLNYEIPNVKKQMTRMDQQSDECLKRIQDLDKTENVLLNEHAALCQQLGIKGENLKTELTEKLKELPKIYDDSIVGIKKLQKAVNLYEEISKNSDCLPILKHVIEHGNTTVYQLIYKEVPLKIEENEFCLNIVDDNQNVGNNEIDFGDGSTPDTNSNSAEIIDFGDIANASDIQLESGGDIDWGEAIEVAPSDKIEIDFEVPLEEYGIIVEGAGMDGGLAKGYQSYTILDSPKYRDKFIDELYELESFLKLRKYELEHNKNNLLFLAGDSSHSICPKEELNDVQNIIASVQSEQTQHLFQLKHSQKYADILVNKLKQKLIAVEKIKTTQELLKVKSVELKKQKEDLKPVLNDLVEKTKILKNQIENDISRRYKNRVVNLIGVTL